MEVIKKYEQFHDELVKETIGDFTRYTQYASDSSGYDGMLKGTTRLKWLADNYSYVKKGQPILELFWFAWNWKPNEETVFIVTAKRDGYIYFNAQEGDLGRTYADNILITHGCAVYCVTDDIGYIEKMKQIDRELAERMNKPVVKVEKKCYLYIMRDDYNGAYKIGIANNPKKRERTLQSDKPSITLHKCVEFKNRQEASNAEKYLHSVFESQGWKRSDGKKSEWFKLGTNDLNWILSKWNWENVA